MAKRFRKSSDEPRPVQQQKYKKSKEWNFATHAEADKAKAETKTTAGEILKIRRRKIGFDLVLYAKLVSEKTDENSKTAG